MGMLSLHIPRCLGYRIVEFKNDKMHTLFHGNQGSRILEHSTWMQADTDKFVRDGGHSYYKAGWHVIREKEYCEAYLSNFRKPRDLRVIEVWHEQGFRFKPSNPKVLLTEWLYIPRYEYEKLFRGC